MKLIVRKWSEIEVTSDNSSGSFSIRLNNDGIVSVSQMGGWATNELMDAAAKSFQEIWELGYECGSKAAGGK
jgi:hypothetical protein